MMICGMAQNFWASLKACIWIILIIFELLFNSQDCFLFFNDFDFLLNVNTTWKLSSLDEKEFL